MENSWREKGRTAHLKAPVGGLELETASQRASSCLAPRGGKQPSLTGSLTSCCRPGNGLCSKPGVTGQLQLPEEVAFLAVTVGFVGKERELLKCFDTVRDTAL